LFDPPRVDPFVELIRKSFDGQLVHYSTRLRLFREADRRGIGRFQANLLIAAVQHEQERNRPAPQIIPPQTSGNRWLTAALLAVGILIEFVAVAAWWRRIH
jgi:hypothetical protein